MKTNEMIDLLEFVREDLTHDELEKIAWDYDHEMSPTETYHILSNYIYIKNTEKNLEYLFGGMSIWSIAELLYYSTWSPDSEYINYSLVDGEIRGISDMEYHELLLEYRHTIVDAYIEMLKGKEEFNSSNEVDIMLKNKALNKVMNVLVGVKS